MSTATHVLWQSILRTIIPVAVGGILGWFASAGIEPDPELESALVAAFTGPAAGRTEVIRDGNRVLARTRRGLPGRAGTATVAAAVPAAIAAPVAAAHIHASTSVAAIA